MRRLAVSVSPSGPHIVNHGERHPDRHFPAPLPVPDPLSPASTSTHAGPRDGSASSQSREPTPIPSPASVSAPILHTQRKKRRPKRSEEERINFFRTDPYVAQFEAYRVLCAGCDKWIRLRSNSSYCSIPWEAHRKSCLAKKGWDLSISRHWLASYHRCQCSKTGLEGRNRPQAVRELRHLGSPR